MSTVIICLIIVILCLIGLRSTIKRVAHGCCGSGGNSVKRIKASDRDISHYPYHYTVTVEGMTCGECKKRVENAFNGVEGYYAVVNLKQKKADVYAKAEKTEDEIKETIWRSGYEPGVCTRC